MWDLEFSAEAEWDFELIFDHLANSYVELGDDPDAGLRRAADRTREIRSSVNILTKSPVKRRRFPREITLLAARWYCRYTLSCRDGRDLLAERGVSVTASTIHR